VVSVYGGASIEYQTNDLKRGSTIVVATPGRLLDLIERKAIQLKELEVVCIDEADTML
jgi:ATP-dependent RNA helicase DeaD